MFYQGSGIYRIVSLVITALLSVQGCAFLQLDRGANEYQPLDDHTATVSSNSVLSSQKLEVEQQIPFVRLAISGGGSRSANFAAAVMEELDRYGFLENVTAISAVSGGTLPAAYYALHKNDRDWNWRRLRELMRTNFYNEFLWKHFNPWGLLNYIFTEYNRSDMMADVFDDILFHRSTFGDLPAGPPQLIINATAFPGGQPWRFTEQNLRSINSRFDTYPIARAIAASTSVPGIFNGIPLRNYQTAGSYTYIHLLDGGIEENLGLQTLLDMYRQSVQTPSMYWYDEKSTPIKACFIFLVDSFPDMQKPYGHETALHRRDLRSHSDFIIDRNLMSALDIMSNNAHTRTLDALSPTRRYLEDPYFTITYYFYNESYHCTVWRLHAAYLRSTNLIHSKDPKQNLVRWHLAAMLPTIETHWKLVAPNSCSSLTLQDALYEGAKELVRKNRMALEGTKRWFKSQGIPLKQIDSEDSADDTSDFIEHVSPDAYKGMEEVKDFCASDSN